ncbi:hypothetical protein BDN71DRAFT_1505823 [Pleurotus eryngii]|uniref:Uncharacterized protein n=1 Tax=Pleurotus eryngii TaxID=5323 RepID=A0A9P6D7W8_PLEER|nr:hypothetical protein BDN71DRAFT_1505823 [Pleurotus eryngii]
MGHSRPRLYNTPEERALANHSKSKHSYYKNKSTTCVQNPPEKAETTTITKPVGRPKLYKSPEDRVAANRAKSKRSYAKCKAALNVRKAVHYQADTSDSRGIFADAQRQPLSNIDPTTVPGWMALMSKTSAEFAMLTRGCSRSYMEGLYHCYVLSRRTEHFSDTLLVLKGL